MLANSYGSYGCSSMYGGLIVLLDSSICSTVTNSPFSYFRNTGFPEPIHPTKFWKAMFGYYYHNDGNVSSAVFEKYYDKFINKYLKYPGRAFTFQLDIFTQMRDRWLEHFTIEKDSNSNKKISAEQKVIEVLAVHRALNFEELVEKTQESEAKIHQVLSTHTLEHYRPVADNTQYMYQNVLGKKHNKKYQDFLLHSTITIEENNDGIRKYALSLFGIMLALSIIRYHDMNKLKQGLYYTDISLPDYYDKIASNYEDKLPLIFGKWDTLKDVLRLFSVYNFDIILDKDFGLRDSYKISILRGGNKELFDSIREIVFQTRDQMKYFLVAGRSVWPEHIPGMLNEYYVEQSNDGDYLMKSNFDVRDNLDLTRVNIIAKNLIEIKILLDPLEHGFSELFQLSPEEISELLRGFEKFFEDEITAFYYFHLYYEHGFNTIIHKPASYYYSLINRGNKPVFLPKRCLELILQMDKKKPLIKEWYNEWIEDISNLQKRIYEILES